MTQDNGDAEAELAELREAVLDDWIIVTSSLGNTLTAMQNTLSWRITKPLRLCRKFGKKVNQVGLADAGQLAAVAVARKIGLRR